VRVSLKDFEGQTRAIVMEEPIVGARHVKDKNKEGPNETRL
jgi:hypothetical protein